MGVDIAYAGAAELSRSFEDFYRAEQPKVFRAALAFSGHREIANEATQEAFGRAFARWRRLSKAEWGGGWVMTTALNLCRRALKREAAPFADAHRAEPPGETRLVVTRALADLSQRQREAVVLFYIGDLPMSEVAERMGITEGAVKSHLARARESLRGRLEVQEDA